MSALITVWTSALTRHAESEVARYVRDYAGRNHAYDSISAAGCEVSEVRRKIKEAFQKLVTMTMSDSTLHIVAVIPLFEDSAEKQFETLYEACQSLDHNVTLHVLGLWHGLRPIFEASSEDRNSLENCRNCRALLERTSNNGTFALSYSLIDEYASTGAPVNFTLNSLSRYIALVQIALMQNYYAILSPSLLAAHQGMNLSLGLSSLAFNREATVDMLLGLGFLAALDNVGINNKEVDLQRACYDAECLLVGIESRYPQLFEQSIRPLYRDKGMDKGQAVAEAAQIIDGDIENLKGSILSLLDNKELSLPEKEAVLALLLGRDNENLRGMQYQHEGLLLDDACAEPINLYVNAYNNYCRDTGLLPVRGDSKVLKITKVDADGNEIDDPRNKEALNPLAEIKRLKQEILNCTSYIRQRQDELSGLQQSVALRGDAEDIRKKWRKPEGDFGNIEYKEQPLDDKYEPAHGLKPKNTIDLRKYFSPVRNQLNLGSCTSFAAVSMYEALMNRNGMEGENMMSPAFLYYFSNIKKGRPSGGSNFHEQFEMLGKHGVCQEALYEYDAENPDVEPTGEAVEDAMKHRLLSARQIPLINNIDKSETLKENHRLITSALTEGYPVGISLKIYENLGKNGAFVLHPDDSPEAREEGWHAMVIVGYSEENNFYIVRNSWGPEFGEDGYCYVPMAYIDDPEYVNFACIITEITDTNAKGKADVPTTLANFGATETEIRMAALRNAISKMRIELKSSQNLYAEYYKYYQRLLMELTRPDVQNRIRLAAENAQASHSIDVSQKQHELEESFVAKLKEYRKTLRNAIITMLSIALCLGIISYFTESKVIGIIALGFCGFGILSWVGYKWAVRIKRRQLQEELNAVAKDAKIQWDKFLETQIRYHVAGIWLSKFHKLSLELGSIYDRLVSYNDTLRAWQHSYSSNLGVIPQPEGQMFRTIDATPLLKQFFELNKKEIVDAVDLLTVFEQYKANLNDLDSSHESLREAVRESIRKLMLDFNMTEYLLGESYPYLENINLQEELDALLAVGQTTFRNMAMNATPPVRMVMAKVNNARKAQWESTIIPYFPMQPVHLSGTDPNSIIILTIHPQSSQ